MSYIRLLLLGLIAACSHLEPKFQQDQHAMLRYEIYKDGTIVDHIELTSAQLNDSFPFDVRVINDGTETITVPCEFAQSFGLSHVYVQKSDPANKNDYPFTSPPIDFERKYDTQILKPHDYCNLKAFISGPVVKNLIANDTGNPGIVTLELSLPENTELLGNLAGASTSVEILVTR